MGNVLPTETTPSETTLETKCQKFFGFFLISCSDCSIQGKRECEVCYEECRKKERLKEILSLKSESRKERWRSLPRELHTSLSDAHCIHSKDNSLIPGENLTALEIPPLPPTLIWCKWSHLVQAMQTQAQCLVSTLQTVFLIASASKTKLPCTKAEPCSVRTQPTGTIKEECTTWGAPNTAQIQYLYCHCKASLHWQPVVQHVSQEPHGALIHSKAVPGLWNLTLPLLPPPPGESWGYVSCRKLFFPQKNDHYTPRKETKPPKRHQEP